MRYVAAYLLASLGGNPSPDADCLKSILDSVSAPVDEVALEKVISELQGKDIQALITQGKESLATISSVAAPAAPASSAAPSGPSETSASEAEKKKVEESDDDDIGDLALDLFGD
ncbi:60S acidic ribosomal protein P2-like [Schistocerca gregaria]|uniref:60S acidic ribosomal protein P2-like n=1 Tax=Schistocerca gregaria TaxID=7010 RepID=UPI00211F183F|nr:60S acidic ribosomal protein P2-like [Schistocerca gregaria]